MGDSFHIFINQKITVYHNDGTATMNNETQSYRLKGVNSFGLFVELDLSGTLHLNFIPWNSIHHIGLNPNTVQPQQ